MKRLLFLLTISAVTIFILSGCDSPQNWKDIPIFVKGQVFYSDNYLTGVTYTSLVVVDAEYGETTESPLSALNCSRVKFWYYTPNSQPIPVNSEVEVRLCSFIKGGDRLWLYNDTRDLLKELKIEKELSRPNLLNSKTVRIK